MKKLSVFTFIFDRHLSSILGNKFDHGAESVMPTLLNLVPNSAKVMATSGVAAIRLILRVREKCVVAKIITCVWIMKANPLRSTVSLTAHTLPASHPHHHQ